MKFARHASFIAISSVLALGLIGCGGGPKQEAKTPETTSAPATVTPTETTPPSTTPTTDTTGTGSMGSTSGTGSMGATSAPAEAPMTDENIAAIAGAANTAEVDQGKLAATKAKDPKVKKFGAMMATDHGEVATKHAELLKKTKLMPVENATSTMLASDASKLMDSLKAATGADFDKTYIDAQVKEHMTLLEMLDTKLIPNAKNPDLKSELTSIRTKVAAHLKAAQDLQNGLGMSSTPTMSTGKGTTTTTTGAPPKK
jgi:putative membrane protein